MTTGLSRRAALLVTVVIVGCGGGGGGSGGVNWIDRTQGTAAENLPWRGVASDATGTRLVAITTAGVAGQGGDIWTSADAGATWANRTTATAATGQRWWSVTSDATGSRLVAVAEWPDGSGGDDVWTSADSGATWTKQAMMVSTASLLVGPTVVSDSSGAHVVLADGEIWTSADSGATWTDQTGGTSAAAQNWAGMAADATATRLVAITAYNDIWTSADGGATWTNRTTGTAASAQAWQAVASDSTGTNLVAVAQETLTAGGIAYGLDIWTSADSGATWTNRTAGTAASGNLWWAVASNATGGRIVAVSAHGRENDVWTSADSGTTWTNETKGTPASGQQWAAVASDATGTHLVAVSANPPGGGPCCFGSIWTN